MSICRDAIARAVVVWMLLWLGGNGRAADAPANGAAAEAAPAAAAPGEDTPEVTHRYLLRERRTVLHPDGRRDVTLHCRVRVETKEGIEDVADVSVPYTSYYETATLRQAVTRTRDGRELAVQADAVHDTMPPGFDAYRMYTDVRSLCFSMPAVEVGAEIEYTVEIRGRRPIMERQGWDSFLFDEWVPVTECRYVVQSPAAAKLQCRQLRFETPPDVKTEAEWTVRTWVLRDLPALEYEVGMPPANEISRGVVVTTLDTWESVGAWFGAMLQGKTTADAALRTTAQTVCAGLTTPRARAQALSLHVQRHVRYVGIELGRGAYEPHAAADTLRNLYGDCKDQSVLLTVLLREVGVTAFPALLRPNYQGELWRGEPSPAQFSHCVVYVPDLDGQACWLDPTVGYFGLDAYPAGLDGVAALVIRPAGAAFVTVPPLAATANAETSRTEVTVRHDGVALFRFTKEYVGRAGADDRRHCETQTKEERENTVRGYERFVEQLGGNSLLLGHGHSDPLALEQPFTEWVEYETDAGLEETGTGMRLVLRAADNGLLSLGGWGTREREAKRRQDWRTTSHRTRRVTYRFRLPPGYRALTPARADQLPLPQGEIGLTVATQPDGCEASVTVTSRPCRVAAADWLALHQRSERVLAGASLTLDIEDEVDKLLADSQFNACEARLAAWLQARPDDAALRVHAGRFFLVCGRYGRARHEWEAAIRLAPGDLPAYECLADSFARVPHEPNPDPARHLAPLVQAAAQARNRRHAQILLAAEHQVNANGRYQGAGFDAAAAVAVYRALLAAAPKYLPAWIALGDCLLAAGRLDEAAAATQQAFALDNEDERVRAQLWTLDVLQGRPDAAVDAIRKFHGDAPAGGQELDRLYSLLVRHRRYAEAARWMELSNPGNAQSQKMKALKALLQRLAAAPQPDFRTWLDRRTPLNTVVSFAACLAHGRQTEAIACLSPGLNTEPSEMLEAARVLSGRLGSDSETGNLGLDTMLQYEVTTEPVATGDLRLVGRAPDLGDKPEQEIYFLRQAAPGGDWQIVAFNDQDTNSFGRLAYASIEAGDEAKTSAYLDLVLAAGGTAVQVLDAEPFPDEAARLRALTGVLVGRDRVADTVRLLGPVATAMPGSAPLQRGYAAALLETGQCAAARAIAEALVAKSPRDRMAQGLLLQILVHERQFDALLARSEALLQYGPNRKTVVAMLLLAAVSNGDAPRAKDLLTRYGRELPPEDLVTWRARIAGLEGDRATLAEQVQAFLRNTTGRADLTGLVVTLMRADDLDAALEVIESRHHRRPNDDRVWVWLALTRALQGDRAEALAIADHLARFALADLGEESLFDLGGLRLALDQPALACPIFQQAAEHGRPAASRLFARLMLAVSQRLIGQPAAAETTLAAAAKQWPQPDWPRPILDYAQGRLNAEALLAAATARDGRPDGGARCEALVHLALLALAAKNQQQADAWLDQAVATRATDIGEYYLARIRRTPAR